MTFAISALLNFPTFYERIKKEKISIQVAYKLSRLKKEIDFQINFYQENMRKIVEEYAQKDESGEMIRTPDGESILLIPEKISECTQKIQELADFKVEISNPHLTLEDFDNLTLELEYLEPIFPFLE